MKKREFSPEQIDFIRESIQEMSTRECARAFTEKFGEPLGQTQLRRVMDRKCISASVKRNDCLPVGYERYSAYYDCMIVKVNDYHVQGGNRKIRNKNWRLKQTVVWEHSTGKKLPKAWVVMFLDGDRMNYNPENLYAVPLHVAGLIEKMHMHSEDPEIYKTALIWGQLYFTLKEVNGRAYPIE